MSLFKPPTGVHATEDDVIGRRMGAVLVDALLVYVVFYSVIRVLGGPTASGSSLEVVGLFFWFLFSVMIFWPLLAMHGFAWSWSAFAVAIGIWIVYTTLFEAVFGQTVGKRAVGLVVTDTDGKPCSFPAAAIRNALRVIDGLGFYGVGLLVVAFTERRQRLGDRLAGTVVARVAADGPVDGDTAGAAADP